MYCTKCGREISEEAIFCPGCGQRVGEKEETKEAKEQEKTEFSLNEQKEKDILSISFLAGAIIITIISCLSYVLVLQIVLLSLSLGLSIAGLVFYIKKRNLYMFISFAIALIDAVFCAGMIMYICSLK